MDDKSEATGFITDRDKLPSMFPTSRHSPEFWEWLGRTVATYGFLEETLRRAIFAITGTRPYASEAERDEAFDEWKANLEKTLKGTLSKRAEAYGKAVRDHPDCHFDDIDNFVEMIKKASETRNVLCHGSYGWPDDNGASLPWFINRELCVFETPIDISYLQQVQKHVAELICEVVDSVTRMGLQFPGGNGPGQPIMRKAHDAP